MSKTDIDKMSMAIINELKAFKDVTISMMEEVAKETAKETVKDLKSTSPNGATGDYAKSWKCKRDIEAKGENRYNMIIYSQNPEYRLTHLLEYGHAIKRGGRTIGKAKAYPHIQCAEKNATTRLENKIIAKIGGG